MSEKKSFTSLLNKLQGGLKKVNEESKLEAEREMNAKKGYTNSESIITDPDEFIQDGETNDETLGDAGLGDLRDEADDEPLIIDGELEPEKPKSGLAALSVKQKALGIIVIIGAAFAAQSILTNKSGAPVTAFDDEYAELDSMRSGVDSADPLEIGGEYFDSGTGSLDFDFGNDLDETPVTGDEIVFDMNGPNNELTHGLDSPDEDAFSFLDENQVFLDPFSQEVVNEQQRTELFVFEESDTAADSDTAALSQQDFLDLGEVEANAPQFGGTSSVNPDSGKDELLDQAKAEISNLQTELGNRSARIGELEKELNKVQKDLEKVSGDLAKAKASTPKPTAKPRPAPQRQMARVAQAPAAKPVPKRPQLCVAAIAQAARNCTTCVPHAFVTHNGNESMLGQGDFVESMRVSIVGDRLDLQNSEGEVVHKFWSSPNGCTS